MRYQLAFLAALLATTTIAQAKNSSCTGVNSVPTTISTPGSYCLTADLVSTGAATAITVAADYVDLDLDGHTLTGPANAAAGVFGIYAIAQRDVHVHNGTVRGFDRGVFLTDTLVGFPATDPSGASTRHEIDHMRIEGAAVGISVLGHFSSVHDNVVLDARQFGIGGGSSYVNGKTGAINIQANQVLNTVASVDSHVPVYGISAGGTGSVVQDNFISTLRGPTGSAAIFAGGAAVIVSRNREADLGTAWSVLCSSSGYPPARVEGNIDYRSANNLNGGINSCVEPTGQSFNNNFPN